MNHTDDSRVESASAQAPHSLGAPLTGRVLRPLVIACQFLTVLRLSSRCHEPAPHELAASMAWYPLVGLILGGVLVLADLAASAALAPVVVNGLLLLVLVLLTGGLHQDGLADTLDGLAGGRTPAERLAIMRDPRIGALGATGLVLALLLRYAGLMALPQGLRLPVLLAMPALGRWAMVVGSYRAVYARAEGGLAHPFLAYLSARHVVVATLLVTLPCLWLLGPLVTACAIGLAAIIGRTGTAWMRRRLGGVTGDTLGAANEVTEIAFLLACPALLALR